MSAPIHPATGTFDRTYRYGTPSDRHNVVLMQTCRDGGGHCSRLLGGPWESHQAKFNKRSSMHSRSRFLAIQTFAAAKSRFDATPNVRSMLKLPQIFERTRAENENHACLFATQRSRSCAMRRQ